MVEGRQWRRRRPLAASDFLWSILSSEGWVVRLFFCAVDDSWFELVAEFVDQLHFVVLPDCVSQVVDQFEDGAGLLGCPVGRDLQRDGEGQAGFGFGHDFVLRRLRARCSDRSWASLRRWGSPSMARGFGMWTRREP